MNNLQEEMFAQARIERSIGAILIDTGKLRPEDAERVLRVQQEKGLRFGEAAQQLGLVTEADLQFSLAQQFSYPYLQQNGQSEVLPEVIAAYQPFSAAVEHLRTLRSQLILRWFRAPLARKTLAIVSPETGEGRSYLTANLAVVFSQLGERTLLIDGDMRKPRQHALFNLDNQLGLSTLLAARANLEDVVQRVPSLRDLSVLTAGATPPNPVELLSQAGFINLLAQAAEQYDVVLIDTPAGTLYADGIAVASRALGAVVVARKNITHADALSQCAENLRQAGVDLVGSVINTF